jgi:hypothetical protein
MSANQNTHFGNTFLQPGTGIPKGQPPVVINAGPREMTFGEKAVGLSFNPSGDGAVESCKRGFASVIDQMHDLRENTANAEVKRMASIAITEAQTAQMWAVKAITWRG